MGKFPIASLLRFRSAKRNLARLLAADGDFHSFAGFNKRVLEKDCFRQSLDAPYGKMSTPGAALGRLCSCRANGFVCTTSRPFSSLNNDVGVGKDDDAVVLGGSVILDDANGDGIKGGVRNGSDLGMVGEQPHKGEVGTSRDGGIVAVTDRDPVDLYKELCDAETYNNLEHSKWTMLQEVFSYFSKSGWASSQALAMYIGMSYFPIAARKFCNFFCDNCSYELAGHVLLLGPSDDAVRFLFPIFVEYCIEHFPDEIKRFKNMTMAADLTKPDTWFPFARAMKRKIIYHCGPTNSGKTYNALQRFMEAKKGIYCSPLRLLAMEVFDKVNAHGIYCSLLTGQEKKILPFSSHIACTIEMASKYDVAVIDEIQMMADTSRGYAWTRALLGLTADEIHLCGDPSVLNIVRKICSGDELHEEHYERFKPLVVEEKTLMGDLKNVRSGDCVVVFSRREIFEVKMAIERYTKHRCCTIYGALPPETRRQQAHLFDDQDNEFDVLVASDAVGMGLNLNIRRVVFYNLSKYNGDKVVPVPASQIKQIAGRAGRRGSCYPHGLTTTLYKDDVKYLIQCLDPLFVEVKNVGLYPFFQQIEQFAGQFPNMTLPQLLENFGESCRLDGSYFLCNYDHIKKVGNMLQKVQGLSLEDRFNFCFAPVNVRDPKAMHHLLKFALAYSQNHPVNVAMGMPKRLAKNDTELLELESKHQVCSMYLWLSNQYGEDKFPYKKRVETMATDIAERLGQSLIEANWMPEARGVRKPGPEIKKNGYERPHSLIKMRVKGVPVPLLDSKGNLAGTHRAISTQTGTSAGVGFATPSSTVPANSLAAKAGLLPTTRGFAGNIVLGDVIVAVDSKPVKSKAELDRVLDDCSIGDEVTLMVHRRGENLEVAINLEEKISELSC